MDVGAVGSEMTSARDLGYVIDRFGSNDPAPILSFPPPADGDCVSTHLHMQARDRYRETRSRSPRSLG